MSVSGNLDLGNITFDGANIPSLLNVQTNGPGGSAARTLTIRSGIELSNTSSTINFNANSNGNLSVVLGGVAGTNKILNTRGTSTLIISPTISGSGFQGIEKVGAGTVVLNGVNTYEGETVVSAGTLIVKGSHLPNDGGGYTVNSGGTLRNAGLIRVEGSANFNSGSALEVEINSDNLTFGSIDADGLFIIENNVTLTLIDVGSSSVPLGTNLYIGSGYFALSGEFADYANGYEFSLGANRWQVNYNAQAVWLTAVAVPEPSAILLLGFAACFGALPRRRLKVW
jgi:autotransporter-associated beta strand protein